MQTGSGAPGNRTPLKKNMTWYKEQLWITYLVCFIGIVGALMDAPGGLFGLLGPFWIISLVVIQILKRGKGSRD